MRNIKEKLLSGSVIAGLALTAFAVTAPTTAAFAQADDDNEIIVTGSRLKRTDLNSTNPISVFTAEDLKITGVSTLEDFTSNLTLATGGDIGSQVNNGSGGQATVSLRGLGANRTLVLLNDQRVAPANTGGYADLNLLPVNFIDRIEILRDGASTVYGSDAIAGVVNIITKQQFEGVEFGINYSMAGEGDGEGVNPYLSIGGATDRGHFALHAEYYDRGEINQSDRSFSACPYTEVGGEIICGGSGTSYPAHIFDVTDDPNATDLDYVLVNGTVRPWNIATDAYNYAAASYMVTPMETLNIFADASYTFIDDDRLGTVDAVGEFYFANRTSQQQLAPVGTFWFPEVPAWHPGNPFGDAVLGAGNGRGVVILRRLAELEQGRFFTQDADSMRIVSGFEGELTNGVEWDFKVNYGKYLDSRLIEGQANPIRAAEVLCNDPASIAESSCQTAANLIWDPFVVNSLTQDIQDYMLVPHSPISRTEKMSIQANASGEFPFVMPAASSPIQWAIGFEHRDEEAEFTPDGAASIGQIYFVPGEQTKGGYNVNEIYAETRIPIIEDSGSLGKLLAAELSFRKSEYSNVGSADNYKAAVEWAPNDDIRLRAVYNTGFRAPSVGELFSPQRLSAQQYSDPCLNYGANSNTTVQANCTTDGLPANFSLSSNQANSIFGGNPSLKPEESEGISVGAAITPTPLPEFSLSVDYFSVEVTDAIGTAGTDNVITGCYDSTDFSSPLCNLIVGPTHPLVGAAPHATSPRRDAVGTISGVLLTSANLATFEVEGIDFAARYSMEGPTLGEFPLGDVNFSLEGTYQLKYDYLPFSGGTVVSAASHIAEDQFSGNPAAFPEWQVKSRVGFDNGTWSANWTSRFMSEVTDINASTANLDDIGDAMWYHDLQFGYTNDRYSASLVVKNLLDEEPPYVTNYDDMNTINQSYDTVGRYFQLRLSAKY